MKRNLTVVCILIGLCAALFGAVAVLGFVFHLLYVGVIGCIATGIALWMLAGSIARERLYLSCEAHFRKGDYAGARTVLDKASRNVLLFPVYRVIYHQLAMKTALALDDVSSAVKHIEALRHAGGTGWKYRTAFYAILIDLDWEELESARTEYGAFAKDCGHAEIYREQLDILRAVFARIDGEEVSLPEGAKRAPYPVLHRIVDKYC